jgi:hypothetical protein
MEKASNQLRELSQNIAVYYSVPNHEDTGSHCHVVLAQGDCGRPQRQDETESALNVNSRLNRKERGWVAVSPQLICNRHWPSTAITVPVLTLQDEDQQPNDVVPRERENRTGVV